MQENDVSNRNVNLLKNQAFKDVLLNFKIPLFIFINLEHTNSTINKVVKVSFDFKLLANEFLDYTFKKAHAYCPSLDDVFTKFHESKDIKIKYKLLLENISISNCIYRGRFNFEFSMKNQEGLVEDRFPLNKSRVDAILIKQTIT